MQSLKIAALYESDKSSYIFIPRHVTAEKGVSRGESGNNPFGRIVKLIRTDYVGILDIANYPSDIICPFHIHSVACHGDAVSMEGATGQFSDSSAYIVIVTM